MNSFSGRFHVIVEQQVDSFVQQCHKHLKEKKVKAWVIKNDVDSFVAIGDPDSLPHKINFGFVIPYESIVCRLDDAFEEFIFKTNHFIKVANSTNRFKVFKNEPEKLDDSKT